MGQELGDLLSGEWLDQDILHATLQALFDLLREGISCHCHNRDPLGEPCCEERKTSGGHFYRVCQEISTTSKPLLALLLEVAKGEVPQGRSPSASSFRIACVASNPFWQRSTAHGLVGETHRNPNGPLHEGLGRNQK